MDIKKIKYTVLTLGLFCISVNATSLKDVVEHTVNNNQNIFSKSLNNEAFRKYIDEKRGGYYPKVDLTAYLERKKIDENYDESAGVDSDTTYKGANVALDLEQTIYDGNLTSSQVEEAKARFSSNKYKNSNDVENIIYDSILSYLNILKFDERIDASQQNLTIHNNYLSIANETERINGEVLDKVQTSAKIYSAKNNLLEEMNSKNSALSSFVKNVGMKVEDEICRPEVNASIIPENIDELYKNTIKNNYEVLEQIENIRRQRAILEQEDSSFLPTLKLRLKAVYDKDLLDKDLITRSYSGKLELKYNLFNGFIDKARTQREKLFLKESQAKLDVVTKKVIDELTNAYNTYTTSKKQVEELKKFIEENKQIIDIYNDQFDAGTRNFIDVLNVEADLYNSKVSLINTEYRMYQAYYQILKANSSLYTSIQSSPQQSCSEVVKKRNELKNMMKDNNSVEEVLSEELIEATKN